jgi:hypothetical protein
MPSIKIESEELDHYQSLERAVYALQYFLVDCKHPGWCDCKYQVRRVVTELATRIDAHKTANYMKVMAKESSDPSWSSDFGKGPAQSDWAKSSGGFQLPGPETP